jgi:PAS domain S-box-containing protein
MAGPGDHEGERWGGPAARVVLLYLLFGLAFFAVTAVFITAWSDTEVLGAWAVVTAAFLAASGVLLIVLVQREIRRRRDDEARLHGRANQLRRLLESSAAVSAGLTAESIVRAAAGEARELLGGRAAEVVAELPDGRRLHSVSPEGTGMSRREDSTVGASLTGTVHGFIRVADSRTEFADDDESILASLAQTVSVALSHAEMYAETRRSEARLAAVVDDSPLGIIELDLDGAVLRANRSAARMLGWESTTPPDPLFDDVTAAAVAELRHKAAAGETVSDVDLRLPGPDGTEAELSLSAAPVRGAKGEIIEVVLVLVDVSERYELQERVSQAQRLESLGRMAGGVAHDFNNLLTVILGYSEIILGRLAEDDPTRSQVDAIRRAGEQAGELTDHLLTLSRRRVTEPVVLDTNEVVNSFGGVLGRLVGPNVDVNVETADEALLIEVDRGQLEQVLLNLAVNGRDAMPDGGTLVIATRPGRMPNSGAPAVVLEVRDTGIGMDETTASQCFEPFFTTKQHMDGTGLGLSLVYGAVTQARGQVTLTTEVGKGTAFTVHLPTVAVAEDDEPGDEEPTERRSGRILLVEDEEDVRAFVRRVLEQTGYEVTEAATGSDALVAATVGRPPDLLVTDILMPGMTGVELARRLREIRPGLPVLLVSGFADDPLVPGDQGMRFLTKPFRRNQLLAAVHGAMDVRARNGNPRPAR